MSKKILSMSSAKLTALSIGLLVAVFCTIGMSFTPSKEGDNVGNPNDSTYVSGPRRSHKYTTGTCGTNHHALDWGKVIAETRGNGYVTISSSGGGIESSKVSPSASTVGSQAYIVWNCNDNTDKSNSEEAKHRRDFTLTATADEGYSFSHWSTKSDGSDEVSKDATIIKEQYIDDWSESSGSHEAENEALTTTYYAIFKSEVMATITFAVPEHGSYAFATEDVPVTTVSSTTGQKTLTTKKAITFTATPASGYKFFGWYIGSDSPENYLSYNSPFVNGFDGDATICAKFVPTATALFTIKETTLQFYDLNTACSTAASGTKKVVVPLATSTLSAGNYAIPSGVTLLVPYDAEYTVSTNAPQKNSTNSGPTVFRKLTLASGVKIQVSGSICVNAVIRDSQNSNSAPSGASGFIEMNSGSQIELISGAKLYSWGCIIGDGDIFARSNSAVYEPFQANDYPGGTFLLNNISGLKSRKIFPIRIYCIPNIQSRLHIEYGAQELLSAAFASMDAVHNIGFIGSSSGMFRLSSGSTITKWYDKANDKQRFSVAGNAELSNISMQIQSLVSVDSKEFVLPITHNMQIDVLSGTTTINYDVELLPGAKVVVGDNAKMNIKSGASVYVYDVDEWVQNHTSANGANKSVIYGRTKTTSYKKEDLPDAIFEVNGEVIVNGALYTTTSGGDIMSSNNGQITINALGTATTLNQVVQSGSSLQSWAIVSVGEAQLHNDETLYPSPYNYTATAGTAAGTTIEYHHGHWGWATIWVDTDGSTILHRELGQNQPQANYTYTPESGYEFDGWSTTTDNTNKETVYTATVHTGEYLDIVDAADNSLTINMTPFPLSGWPYQVNEVVYRRTTSGEGTPCNADRTITISHSAAPGEPLTISVKNGADYATELSRHKYYVPFVYESGGTLSGTDANSIVFVHGGTLTVSGTLAVKALYVAPGAELNIAQGGTLTVEKLVLRTSPWSAAILTKTGTLNVTNVYYSRQVADNSGYFQFGLPLSTTCNVEDVTLSDGSTPTYGSAWILKSYSESLRAANGAADNPETQNNWVMLPGDNPVTGGVGYEIFSGSKYYREYYFPVDMTALTNSVAVTRTEGAAGAANAGWNVVCSPLMNVYTVSPAPEGMVFSWLREEGDYEQLPVTEVKPAIPFSYQAKASGNITFGNDIKVPSAIAARRVAAAEEPTRIQWIHLDIEDEAGIGDQTSIYSHPTRYEQTYQTGIDVAKQSLTASRAIIYSSHAYGDMAFAGVADSLLESGVALTVYSPAAQELTFSLRENEWLNRMEAVWLIDKQEGMRLNLLNGYYTFNAPEGTTRGRFFIQGQFKAPNIATDLEPTSDSSLKGREIRKVIINQKMYIIVGEQIYDGTGKLVNK